MQPYAEEFYGSPAWKRCREAYKKKAGGLCEQCLSRGLYNPAEMVHHKIHITPENITDPKIVLNFDNLEALCRDCHAKMHGREKRYRIDESGRVEIKS